MSRILAIIFGGFFGLALPLMGMSGSTFLVIVYWTIVFSLFGACMLQECRGSLVNRD
jgi:hypothetical protein